MPLRRTEPGPGGRPEEVPEAAETEALSTAAGIRDESRSRRVRALLCTAPLHELQTNRKSRGGVFPDLDCYDLALGAIDFVVDKMGFDTGANPEEVVEHIFGEIVDWVPAAEVDEGEAAARAINEVLIRPQRGSYSGPDDPTRRPFDFALLREAPAPEGIRVVATDEAINVLVGALDTDIASAVTAADARIESLISRERYSEAELAARDARIRSIQYMAEVRRIIADTRLDVRRAGWGEKVPDRLKEIVDHLAARMSVESRMLDAMRESRDTTVRTELVQTMQRLIDVVAECLNRHRELHNRVLDASEAFFAEHARQAFQTRIAVRAVDLYDKVFLPAMRGTLGNMGGPIEAFAARSWGLADLRVGDINGLLEVLLADPIVVERLGEELPDDELATEDDSSRYPGRAWELVTALLESVETPVRLSKLLSSVRGGGGSGEWGADLLAARALQATDPALEELRRRRRRVLAAADDGEELMDLEFDGPDLLVGWLEPHPEMTAQEVS